MSGTEAAVMERKATLRGEIKARFAQLAPGNLEDLAAASRSRLRELDEYRRAGSYLFYAALKDEPDLDELIDEALAAGKNVYLPLCRPADNEMDVVRIADRRKDLVPRHFGILEPRPELPVADPAEIDLAVLPGRAFDRQCRRLGRGRAYVDRFLTRNEGRLFSVSLAAGFQLVREVPVNEYDRPVNAVITESEVIRAEAE